MKGREFRDFDFPDLLFSLPSVKILTSPSRSITPKEMPVRVVIRVSVAFDDPVLERLVPFASNGSVGASFKAYRKNSCLAVLLLKAADRVLGSGLRHFWM